ncbi:MULTISPECIES: DUF3006 domain-containing protein [unclassified Haladaptatus]|uniref:DUF3006 domain-containing protein n=1 Tax=unclassified Haladaptatus TaxID=2622732 RepID=UPI0023E78440|nr:MULTISPECIES: DUF3006 domain-containing protein [unclassified Haladaptatus]
MVTDGAYTAVIDRIEDNHAVLLIEEGGKDVDELVVHETKLPFDMREPNLVVHVTLEGGKLRSVDADREETAERMEDAQSRFDRLAKRPPETEQP